MTGPPRHLSSLMRSRRGVLGTVGPDGNPNVLPICFTWAGDVLWTPIDGKPKSTHNLQRLRDVKVNPHVTFMVDRWDEDWTRLAWLQAHGSASILPEGAETERAYAALRDKYPQYDYTELAGPVIRIDVDRWVGWAGDEGV
ncbi:MAG TPA: TIGR03668 family PPOX class F420-dependent oxidoreductase [Actinomycetota bacterium]